MKNSATGGAGNGAEGSGGGHGLQKFVRGQ